MNDESSDTGRGEAESKSLNSDPRASESADLTALIVESFPPVQPHPHVWRRIHNELRTETERSGRNRVRRGIAVAAVIALILGVAGTVAMGTTGLWPQQSPEGVTIRDVADPNTSAVALTLHTNADGSTTAQSAEALPTLDEGLTYQLWSVVGTEVVSVGVLGRSVDSAQLRLEGDPTVLALTIEVTGGVAVSSASPVAVWTAAG